MRHGLLLLLSMLCATPALGAPPSLCPESTNLVSGNGQISVVGVEREALRCVFRSTDQVVWDVVDSKNAATCRAIGSDFCSGIPDDVQGGYAAAFAPACLQHDRCYNTSFGDTDRRADCDRWFRTNMLAICAYANSAAPPGCQVAAAAYYDAVNLFAQPQYASGQCRGHCRGCSIPARPPGPSGTRITAKLLLLKDNEDTKKRKLLFVSKDPSIPTAPPSSLGDPRCGSQNGGPASIRVDSRTSGESFYQRLPCQNWELLGSETAPKGYKYLDKDLANGPCKLVLLRRGKLAKAVCLGKGAHSLDFDLTGTGHVPVTVEIHTADRANTYAGHGIHAEFGGEVIKDGTDGKTLRLKNAREPRLAACDCNPFHD